MDKKLKDLLLRISTKQDLLDQHRPLDKALLKNLHDWYKIELAYSSNAIEGNTLTKSETAIVVEKGLTIAGKSVREHLEAINHGYAFDYVVSLASKKRSDITLQVIKDIHQLVLKKIDDSHAGIFRLIKVKASGSDYIFPDALKVQELMEQFISWLHETEDNDVLVAAHAHLRLVTIHPFVDGNGRVARLLMNLLLIQTGLPPAIILPEKRSEYINALQEAQIDDNPVPFYIFIAQSVEDSLDLYLKQIG